MLTMWDDREVATGNTFGATILSSYGGFWISAGIVFTPGFQIMSTLEEADGGSPGMFYDCFGLMLMVSLPEPKPHLTHAP